MNNEYNVIKYDLSEEQAVRLANHYNKNLEDIEEYEICELLDRFIDENLD